MDRRPGVAGSRHNMWLEAGGRAGGAATRPRTRAERADDDAPGDLLCAACRARISHDDHRVERGGAHAHTFVNPDGFAHHLGCFAVATHLATVGEPETAFTWFPGWTWQIAVCAACRTHLGWIYRCAGEQFYGLLLAKLVRRGEG